MRLEIRSLDKKMFVFQLNIATFLAITSKLVQQNLISFET